MRRGDRKLDNAPSVTRGVIQRGRYLSQAITKKRRDSDPTIGKLPAWRLQVEAAAGELPRIETTDPRKVGAELHALLRTYILEGLLRPGTVLSQVAVAEDLGVSRTPVREAIRMLKEEGLVEANLNLRAKVAGISYDDIEAIYAQRILAESLALSVAIERNGANEIEQIRRALVELDRAELMQFRQWIRLHRQFHLALYVKAGPSLLSCIQANVEKCERFLFLSYAAEPPQRFRSTVGDEHLDIVQAVRNRNAAAGVSLLSRHLAKSAFDILNDICPQREPRLISESLLLVGN